MIEQVVIIGLAAWRLASLISNEDGPYEIFAKFRDYLTPDPGEITETQVQIIKALSCMWCMTVWTSAILYFVWLITPWPVVILGAMTIAIVIETYVND